MGSLLGPIVRRCKEEGWPPLTALVVPADDHSVGAGYEEVLRAAGEPIPEGEDKLAELDEHAPAARLDCYRHFGAELPEDGGVPTLTPRVKAARQAKKAAEPKPEKLCPIHHLVLPSSGRCDQCD